MGNNQYKGFAYTKGSDKPTVVYGASSDDILAKLNSYNIARTEQDKFMKCNIGSLNTETSKYEDYHRYEVATGKDISPIYLQIPPLGDNQFRKVIADLDAADAKFNSYKKRWYITPDQDLQTFQNICNQFSNDTRDTQLSENRVGIDAIEASEEPEKPNFQIVEAEIQYVVKLENQQTIIVPESAINMWKVNGSMDEFLDKLNEKAVEQLQQISNDLDQIRPEQIVDESEYSISTSKDSADNRCTIWFNDGREPINFHGDEYGLHFPTMEADAVAEFVAEYFRQQDHPELSMQMEYSKGDWIDCYVPLRLQDSSPNQPIYVENVRHIVGRVQNVQSIQAQEGVPGAGIDGKSYEIWHGDGSTETIRSDEIYASDQARVLLRAAADELTGVQFDLLADRRLSAAQMEEIRFGFKDGLSVEQVALYANPNMTPAEMDLCRIGLTNGLEYAELSRLLKETKELSWTDSRNRLNEVIKEHGVIEKARTVAHEAGLAFSENMTPEEIDPYVYDGSMSAEDYMKMLDRVEKDAAVNSAAEPTVTIVWSESDRLREGETMPLSRANELFAKVAQEAAQTVDFYGIKVPLENGMRVITMDAIYHVNEQGIEKPDFSSCVFRGIDFPSFFPTSDVNFANSKFYQCRLIDFDMSQSNFQGASLQETYLKDVVLEQCDFSKASLENVRIRSSELTRVNFSETTMNYTYFENCGIAENDFNMAKMDCVHVYDSCDITDDQKNLDTVTYTISGADPAEIEKMKDKVMWRLSGSEIKYERKEELSRLYEKESSDPDTQEWREDLTYEESELVKSWDKQRHMLSDVLLEKQHRQEHYKERYNNMAAQSEERRSVVNQLHEKQKMVSASAEAPAREDRIKKADAIAK
ncbi:MAG: pentapeptide repeat-containing protein [Lachnospiraceae bacterium]|nr:pentapeptide repeat-containing protein [Lachnospiraceae bacterium]